MRRAALVSAILTILLLADGLYQVVSDYQPGDQNAFTGNPSLILSDGQVVLISAGFLLLVTVVMWAGARRAGTPSRRAPHAGATSRQRPREGQRH
jgi:uncharacterized membrane protein YedE/YeeE